LRKIVQAGAVARSSSSVSRFSSVTVPCGLPSTGFEIDV
jgi:hypothetical protein